MDNISKISDFMLRSMKFVIIKWATKVSIPKQEINKNKPKSWDNMFLASKNTKIIQTFWVIKFLHSLALHLNSSIRQKSYDKISQSTN
jgi:hypothetical protein